MAKKFTQAQLDQINGECRQLYLYYIETTEKYTDAALFISKKQIGMLYALMHKIAEGSKLTEDEQQRANQTVMYFWKARNRRIYRPEHPISKK